MRISVPFYSLVFLFLLLACKPGFGKEILVVAKYDNEPLSYEAEGEMRGIAFQVFRRICEELKLPFAIKKVGPLPWKRVKLYLETNKVDVFLGAEKPLSKAGDLVFSSQPLYQTSYSVFYRRRDPVSLEALSGISGSVLDDLSVERLEHQAGLNLELSQSYTRKQNLMKLMNRRVDYFIAPLLPTLNYISENRLEVIDQIAFIKQPIAVSPNYLVYAPDSPLLAYKERIDAKLSEYQQQDLIDTTIGKEIATWKAFDWYLENNNRP